MIQRSVEVRWCPPEITLCLLPTLWSQQGSSVQAQAPFSTLTSHTSAAHSRRINYSSCEKPWSKFGSKLARIARPYTELHKAHSSEDRAVHVVLNSIVQPRKGLSLWMLRYTVYYTLPGIGSGSVAQKLRTNTVKNIDFTNPWSSFSPCWEKYQRQLLLRKISAFRTTTKANKCRKIQDFKKILIYHLKQLTLVSLRHTHTTTCVLYKWIRTTQGSTPEGPWTWIRYLERIL